MPVKGKQLEKTIMELFKHYENLNIHCQKNSPERLASGIYVRRHGYDFQVFCENKFYAFDAKEVSGDSMNVKTNFKKHQVKALTDIKNHGGVTFFLVYFFNIGKLNYWGIDDVINLFENNIKSIKYEKKRDTKLDFLGILT